jgi:hypothetical protein
MTENNTQRSTTRIAVNQAMRVIAAIGFGLMIGALVYTQSDTAVKFIMSILTETNTSLQVNQSSISITDISFQFILSLGTGMVSAVWFYRNAADINRWVNQKIGLALNRNINEKE